MMSSGTIFSLLPISGGMIAVWAVYAILLFWAVYTLVIIYHWLRYSHASWLTFPAIGVHLFVSFALISFILYGNVPSFIANF